LNKPFGADADEPGERGERLQKLLAAAGLGSRREIERWIREGRLVVDGKPAELGQRATAASQIVLDGKPLVLQQAAPAHQVLVYHKPMGEVSTRRDPQNRPTVFERLPEVREGRWIIIGRLDVNTTGLLLFTTDGALAHRLMHPSSEIQREYLVRIRGKPSPAVLDRLQDGVQLEDGAARFDRIEAGEATASHAWYRVVLHEGRNREVRRLWEAVGFEVSRLIRLRFGPCKLPDDLRPGQWRLLGGQELEVVLSLA
jgi:23S rRNA pseudouridine2605 synthase